MFNNLNKMAYGNKVPKIWAWNLFWWKIEGAEPLNGLNVYPRKDPRSKGFVLKFGRFRWRVRYSKYAKEWHFNVQW
jgi:hypothetical protein